MLFRGKYDDRRLAAFFDYWSEENVNTGRMRFEEQRTWNTGCRLRRWANMSYADDDEAAAIRLRRTKRKLEREEAAARLTATAAARREQADAEREQEAQKSRQGQMLTGDYVRQHPDSLMARVYRENKAREARKHPEQE